MKRSSSGLTGGTGDVNPQWFNLGALAITNAYADTAVQLPRERLPYGNKSQVMEVLKIEVALQGTTTLNVTAGTDSASRVYVTTKSFSTTEPTATQQAGNVIGKWRLEMPSEGTGLSTMVINGVTLIDVTDGAGHGLLVATDNIFIGSIQTAATSPVNGNLNVRLLYRWKNVGLQEYIGIVQSQQ